VTPTPGRQTAIVTGSTRGIGRAIAMRLLTSGYTVVLNYAHNDDDAEATLAACRQIAPHVRLIKADVSDRGDAEAIIDITMDAYGRVDLLVNNAAQVIDKPALELTGDDWDRVLGVNLKGAFLCSQSAAPHMLGQDDGGLIVNIGSSTGIRGRLNGVNTCASKAGLMIMTQCLALEWAPRIRVNTVVPGLVATDEITTRYHLDDPATAERYTSTVPLQRLSVPDDVADAVFLLTLPEARYMTGQKLVIDGGRNML